MMPTPIWLVIVSVKLEVNTCGSKIMTTASAIKPDSAIGSWSASGAGGTVAQKYRPAECRG